jgi:pimeloyl-CoA synthetase
VCEQASERAALAIKKGTNARGARLLYTTTRAREREREREGERASEREKEEPAARQHRLLQNSFLPAALASIASPISRGKILSLCIRWSEICMTR